MPRTVPAMRFAILGTLGIVLAVFAYAGSRNFTAQSIPIDSLYVLGTQGEEMSNYAVSLNEGSGVRIWWNMNTVSTRDGYAIYCGLRRNSSAYTILPAQYDLMERPTQTTTYDFACRSCKTGTQSSCFTQASTDYITTYGRTFSVRVPGSAPPSPSPSPVELQSFIAEGTQGETPSGNTLTLRAGSDVRLAWNMSAETNSVYYYSIYCGMKKDGGTMEQVPLSRDMTESVDRQRSYELVCRNCRNWKDYDGYVDPIVPWNNCWAPTNTDFQETFKKQYVVQRISVCGDGILGSSETCDDANVAANDGCSPSCQTEPSYKCTGTTCVSIACQDGIDNDGDGLIDAQENRQPSTHLFGDEAQIRAFLNGISALITPDPLQEREFLCPNYAQISTKKDPTLPPGQVRLADEEEMKDTAADKFCRLFQWDEAVTVSCVGRSYSDLSGIWGTWKGEQMIREPANYANYAYYNAIRCAMNPDCNDGQDNDYDNKIDMDDPDCTNPYDTSELPADNGCTSADDPSESDGQQSSAATPAQTSSVRAATVQGVSQASSARTSSATQQNASTTSQQAMVQSSARLNRCGDGIRANAEECDDGNAASGDGCSYLCFIEQAPPIVNPPSFVRSSSSIRVTFPASVSMTQASVRPVLPPSSVKPGPWSFVLAPSSPSSTRPVPPSSAYSAAVPPPAITASSVSPLRTTPPVTCGNGKLDGNEQCDRGPANSLAPNADCRPDCTFGRCGDGILDPKTEECDDGQRKDGDGCSSRCIGEGTLVQRLSSSAISTGFPVLLFNPSVPMPRSFGSQEIPVDIPTTTPPTPEFREAAPEPPLPVVRNDESLAPPAFEASMPASKPLPEPVSGFAPEPDLPPQASSPPSDDAPPSEERFSVWHLSVLRPDIFPTPQVAREALLFVEQNICKTSTVVILPYLPYFRCEIKGSALEGNLLALSAGSASLGFIGGALLAGTAWLRKRRR